jgi:hypothetical protein
MPSVEEMDRLVERLPEGAGTPAPATDLPPPVPVIVVGECPEMRAARRVDRASRLVWLLAVCFAAGVAVAWWVNARMEDDGRSVFLEGGAE